MSGREHADAIAGGAPVPGEQAIARIMGLPVAEARRTLLDWYGAAAAAEVLRAGQTWERDVLTRRERSFVAIAALASVGALTKLPIHVRGALHHGASAEEVEEVLLTLMTYAGHGRATAALDVARATIAEQSASGERSSEGPASAQRASE